MGQIGGAVLALQFLEGVGHAVELHLAQLGMCWMIQHSCLLSVEIIRAPDIWVCDRGAVRGGVAALAIQSILENGIEG